MYQKVTQDISDHLKRTVEEERDYNKKQLQRNKQDIITDIRIDQDNLQKEIYRNIEIDGVIDYRLNQEQAAEQNKHQFLHQYLKKREEDTKFNINCLQDQAEKLDEKVTKIKKILEQDIKDTREDTAKGKKVVDAFLKDMKEMEEF